MIILYFFVIYSYNNSLIILLKNAGAVTIFTAVKMKIIINMQNNENCVKIISDGHLKIAEI